MLSHAFCCKLEATPPPACATPTLHSGGRYDPPRGAHSSHCRGTEPPCVRLPRLTHWCPSSEQAGGGAHRLLRRRGRRARCRRRSAGLHAWLPARLPCNAQLLTHTLCTASSRQSSSDAPCALAEAWSEAQQFSEQGEQSACRGCVPRAASPRRRAKPRRRASQVRRWGPALLPHHHHTVNCTLHCSPPRPAAPGRRRCLPPPPPASRVAAECGRWPTVPCDRVVHAAAPQASSSTSPRASTS